MPLSADQLESVQKNAFGVPALSIFSMVARGPAMPKPINGHVGFSPIIPRTGEAIFEARKVFNEIAQEYGLPMNPLVMPFTYWQRAFVFLIMFPVTHDNRAEQAQPRGVPQAREGERRARLGRVSDPGDLSGRRRRRILVQRPCAAAPERGRSRMRSIRTASSRPAVMAFGPVPSASSGAADEETGHPRRAGVCRRSRLGRDAAGTRQGGVRKNGARPATRLVPITQARRALQYKYQGKEPGPLEERKDLAPDLTRSFVRNGRPDHAAVSKDRDRRRRPGCPCRLSGPFEVASSEPQRNRPSGRQMLWRMPAARQFRPSRTCRA